DLYWVGKLGKEAIAAVSLAGNLMLVVLALTQVLGVGTTTLISHAAGRKDQERAQLVFNQSLVLSVLAGVGFALASFALRGAYSRWLGADGEIARLGQEYLAWFIPALALQFALVSMGSALRGTGIVKPMVLIQVATVMLNIILAPILIFGWGPGRALGVAGAALASLISILLGTLALRRYFVGHARYLKFSPESWRPRLEVWWGMLRVGLPAGAEFALLAVYLVLVYWILRPFGADAQAGFGIGGRMMQSMFLPVMAIAFALAPLAGQNFGAQRADRVRESFQSALLLCSSIMLALTAFCHIAPEAMIRAFSREPGVVAFGADYLRIISWNFLAAGIIFLSSSMFQALGNTLPALASSSMRLLLFALPAFLLAQQPGFRVRHIWYVSVVSVLLQAGMNLFLLRREYGRRLAFIPEAGAAPATEPAT
ncbi:MAG: MATE family efflux transporter, partial [Terriglobales bacterium]